MPAGTLRQLLTSDEAGGHPARQPPVRIHPEFAPDVRQVLRIPHPYINLCLAYADGDMFGEGSAGDAHVAMETAIFELMERHLATRFDPARLEYAPSADLAPRAVDVRSFALMSDYERTQSEGDYVLYNEHLPLHWTQCFEIQSDGGLSERLIPATLAYLRFARAHPAERFVATLSAGIASGPSYADAMVHAFYELIERDAFAIAWLNRLSMPVVEAPPCASGYLEESRARLIGDGFKLTLLDLTTDLSVPVFLSIIQQGERKMAPVDWMSLGLGANLDPMRAIQRAYAESLELLVNFCAFDQTGTATPRRLAIADPAFNLEAYFDSCQFLTSSHERVRLRPAGARFSSTSRREELTALLALLHAKGLRLYFVDLTPSGMHGERYRLVRAFATDLQPHLYDWDCWRLDNARLYSSPVASRRRLEPLAERDLNLAPNPYAVMDQFGIA